MVAGASSAKSIASIDSRKAFTSLPFVLPAFTAPGTCR
jgi:hypothetical protein